MGQHSGAVISTVASQQEGFPVGTVAPAFLDRDYMFNLCMCTFSLSLLSGLSVFVLALL